MTDKIIRFDGHEYKTKKDAEIALRDYVATLPLRTWLFPADEQFETVLDALEYHPSWGSRLNEIVKLRFERERGSGLACLVVLDDDLTDKIGWTKSFQSERTPYGKLMAALRHEVRDQIAEYRDAVLTGSIPQVSAISGIPLVLSGAQSFHVDHAPAFADTAAEWIEREGGIERIPTRKLRKGGWEINDDDQANRWWNFHARRHNLNHGLRAITAAENLDLGRHDEVA